MATAPVLCGKQLGASMSGVPTSIDVMQTSPFDAEEAGQVSLVQLKRGSGPSKRSPPLPRWAPSRFNARTTDDNGRLILWNTRTGSMSVFEPHQRVSIESLLDRQGFPAPLEGIVKYLHDRGYLIAEGTDELRRLQMEFGEQHYRTDTLQLILLASEDCNFRCTYCYEDFQRGTMIPSVREGIKNLIRRRAPQLRQLSVSWFGGEPLYGFATIEDLAPFILDTAREWSIPYGVHMTTNGYLLTPDVATKLLGWEVRDFQITLDGTPADHDRKRHGRDGSVTFSTILNNLRMLRDRPDEFSVTIRVNFDQENYPQLDQFLMLLQQDFAGDARFRVSFHAVGRWGGPNDDSLATCGADESRQVQEQLRRTARQNGLNLDHSLREIGSLGKQVCYAARPYNFVIGADGKLMKCTVALDKDDANVIGHISPDGELVYDPDKFALWVEPAFANDSGCRRCHLVPVCQGMSCPLIRMQENRRPCIPARSNLRNELLAALEASGPVSRNVTVAR